MPVAATDGFRLAFFRFVASRQFPFGHDFLFLPLRLARPRKCTAALLSGMPPQFAHTLPAGKIKIAVVGTPHVVGVHGTVQVTQTFPASRVCRCVRGINRRIIRPAPGNFPLAAAGGNCWSGHKVTRPSESRTPFPQVRLFREPFRRIREPHNQESVSPGSVPTLRAPLHALPDGELFVLYPWLSLPDFVPGGRCSARRLQFDQLILCKRDGRDRRNFVVVGAERRQCN